MGRKLVSYRPEGECTDYGGGRTETPATRRKLRAQSYRDSRKRTPTHDKTVNHKHRHLFCHPVTCCRLAICERMLLPSSTQRQTAKLLTFTTAEPRGMTRHQKHKHMHMFVASGHMFPVGAL
jgi:hypothetical protein